VTQEEIAAQIEAEAEGLESSSDPVARAAAKRLRVYATAIRRLPDGTLRGTIVPDMLTPAQMSAVKSSAELRKGSLHPLQAWLYSRDEESPGPRTLEALAGALRLNESRTRSWCRNRDARRIPEHVAKLIERRWGFKAIPENYPNGIKSAKTRA